MKIKATQFAEILESVECLAKSLRYDAPFLYQFF